MSKSAGWTWNMSAINSQLTRLSGSGSTHHAGVAVLKRRLRVEKMGDVAHTRFNGSHGLGVSGVGMPHGNQRPPCHRAHTVYVSRHFRGNGEHAQYVRIFLQKGRVAGANALSSLRALGARG